MSKKSTGDALAEIAEESPEALKRTGDLMEASKNDVIAGLESQLEIERANHAETKRALARVGRELAIVRGRVGWLLGGPFPYETIDDIEAELDAKPDV